MNKYLITKSAIEALQRIRLNESNKTAAAVEKIKAKEREYERDVIDAIESCKACRGSCSQRNIKALLSERKLHSLQAEADVEKLLAVAKKVNIALVDAIERLKAE